MGVNDLMNAAQPYYLWLWPNVISGFISTGKGIRHFGPKR
jgi:hypothetical protein